MATVRAYARTASGYPDANDSRETEEWDMRKSGRGLLLTLALLCVCAVVMCGEARAADIEADNTTWNDGDVIPAGGITISGGTSESPVTITVNGTVTVNGTITVSSGYVTFTGGGTLLCGSASFSSALLVQEGSLQWDGPVLNGGGNDHIGVRVGDSNEKTKSFTMYSGTITGFQPQYSGAGVLVSKNGTFTMSGGTITGNAALYNTTLKSNTHGGGVYVSSGTFMMNGGVITDNTASGNGGGVYATGGTFYMNGGSIDGNTAYYGGGVYLYTSGAAFTMNAGTICNNKSTENAAGVGVYVNTGTTFTMNGGWVANNKENNGTVSDVHSGSEYGTFNHNGGVVGTNFTSETNAKVDAADATTFPTCTISSVTYTIKNTNTLGSTVGEAGGENAATIVNVYGATAAEAVADVSGSRTNLYGCTVNGKLTVNAGMDLYGCMVKGETEVKNSGSLYLYAGAAATHGYTEPAAAGTDAYNASGDRCGTVLGSDTAQRTTVSGGGIIVYDGTLHGGVDVMNYTDAGNAGNSRNGWLALYGAANGTSGALVTGGTGHKVTYTGISEDYYYGGGVYADNGAVLAMYGGAVTGNTVTNGSGGGVYMDDGATSSFFRMYGGAISYNTNGGVSVSKSWTLDMSGGKIAYNTKSKDGAGVYVYGDNGSAVLNLSGSASIENNTAETYTFASSIVGSNGGGVYLDKNGTMTLSGNATVKNNKASGAGGGVCVMGNPAYLTMTGGSITGNESYGSGSGAMCGGGVYVSETGEFAMSGGSITGNTSDAGGGVFVDDSGTFKVSGAVTIKNNQAGTPDWDGKNFSDKKTNNVGVVNYSVHYCDCDEEDCDCACCESGECDCEDECDDCDEGCCGCGTESGASVVTIGGTLSNTDPIGVTAYGEDIGGADYPVTFTSGWSAKMDDAAIASYFKSDNDSYIVALNGSELELQSAPAHAHNHDCNGYTCTAATAWTDELAVVQNGAGKTASNSLPKTPGSYYLTADVTLNSVWDVGKDLAPAGGTAAVTMTLCLNGHKIERVRVSESEAGDYAIRVKNGSTLNLYDAAAGGGTITRAIGTGIGIMDTSTLNMYGGLLTGNAGYGVHVSRDYLNNGATFNMYGGTISDNTPYYRGVRVEAVGTFQVSGKVTITDRVDLEGDSKIAFNGALDADSRIAVRTSPLPTADSPKIVTSGASDKAVLSNFTTVSGYFLETNSDGEIVLKKDGAEIPPAPPTPPSDPPSSDVSYDYTPSATTVTVPVSGDADTVNVTVSVTNTGEATLRSADVNAALTGNNATGTVEIDVGSLRQDVSSVTIPAAIVSDVAEAVASADNATDSLTVKLTDGSVTFDAAAVESITAQAGGNDLRLNLDGVQTGTMNAAQQSAVAELEVAGVLDVYMTSNNVRISDFGGGSAEVRLPFTAPSGRAATEYGVWYVAEDGAMTNQRARYDSSDSCFVFTVTHFSNYVIAYGGCPQDETCPIAAYIDADPAAWYHDGVHWAVENGVMGGWEDAVTGRPVFAPSGDTSRAMVAMILWRLEGEPAAALSLRFNDVSDSAWYADAVRWATSAGVITGYDDPVSSGKVFAPDAAVTREQLAAMLWRHAKYKGTDVSVGEDTNILSYSDAFDISEYAIPAMQWACGAGIVNGMTNGTRETVLAPHTASSRAVVATMLMRYCANLDQQGH